MGWLVETLGIFGIVMLIIGIILGVLILMAISQAAKMGKKK
tara:strand:- start:138 stop:260 length:123 start_codon:yes stop_codon:yes gene_type:complete